MFRDLVLKNRSYRRFYQDRIDLQTLRDLVDLARLSASGSNLQPLKYILSCDESKNALIAPCVGLGGNPPSEERPTAYIIVGDKRVRETAGCDHGIASQSILLGAAEKGLGGCMVGNVKREDLRQALVIAPHLDILLVLVLGKPRETSVIEPVGNDGTVKSYWDDQRVRHVPKRALNEIIIG
jgi:nitroreductase